VGGGEFPRLVLSSPLLDGDCFGSSKAILWGARSAVFFSSAPAGRAAALPLAASAAPIEGLRLPPLLPHGSSACAVRLPSLCGFVFSRLASFLHMLILFSCLLDSVFLVHWRLIFAGYLQCVSPQRMLHVELRFVCAQDTPHLG
jgi:hypothetical protein